MIQKAYRKTVGHPSEGVRIVTSITGAFEGSLEEKEIADAFSDAGVGAYLANAALGGGLLNIEINLRSINDVAFRKEKERLMRLVSKKRDRLMSAIQGELEIVAGS